MRKPRPRTADPDRLAARLKRLIPNSDDDAGEAAAKLAKLESLLAKLPAGEPRDDLEAAYASTGVIAGLNAGDYARAVTAFDGVESAARGPAMDDAKLRRQVAIACEELADAAHARKDRATAERVFATMEGLAHRFPEDGRAVMTAAHAANAAAHVYCAADDLDTVEAALRFVNAIMDLPRLPHAEDRRGCELELVRGLGSICLSFCRVDAWPKARIVAFKARTLLLAPWYLEDLAATRNREQTAAMQGMFCALIEGHLKHDPPADVAARYGRVQEEYAFHETRRVNCGPGLRLDLPARWKANRAADGAWVAQDRSKDHDTGTLWIEPQVRSHPPGMPDPETPVFDEWFIQTFLDQAEAEWATPTDRVRRADRVAALYCGSNDGLNKSQDWLKARIWHLARRHGERLVVVRFRFVLQAFLAGREDFEALVRQLDRAIEAAEIDIEALVEP